MVRIIEAKFEYDSFRIEQTEDLVENNEFHPPVKSEIHNSGEINAGFAAIVRFRSRRPEVFCKKGLFKNFLKFTRKHLCWSPFLIKLQVSGLQLYLKRDCEAGIFL